MGGTHEVEPDVASGADGVVEIGEGTGGRHLPGEPGAAAAPLPIGLRPSALHLHLQLSLSLSLSLSV